MSSTTPTAKATPLELYNHLPLDFDLFGGEPLSNEVWKTKYRFNGEENIKATFERVAKGVYAKDSNPTAYLRAQRAMELGLFMPGGRILAGAGTDKRVTLFNCYVNGTLEDSMEGIHAGYGNVMLTMQQGGGIGTDFTPLRPNGAWLSRTKAPASGPMPFAVAQDAIGQCVESAGERRGAQMGTLADFHPDLPRFITAKHEPGVLTQFNLSILVSDAFMSAVAEDEDWLLYHSVPPYTRDPDLESLDFVDDYTNQKAYVYAKWKAKDLWEMITQSTYKFSEPGVIFIDRVNELNNLQYREQIRCTNPCGEQPLPPHACCNLGAIILATMVKYPFTDDAEFDWALLAAVTKIGVRFLDNVTDVTGYPLPQQEAEQMQTRRIGLGYTGLATAMAQLGLRYGSQKSARFAAEVTKFIAVETYRASAELAMERGAFPCYDRNKFWTSSGFAATHFGIEHDFFDKPLRCGVHNTLAPTGTTSVAFGNIDSGLEPIFMLEYTRNVRQKDNTYKPAKVKSMTLRLWEHLHGDAPLPRHITAGVATELKVHEHILIQGECQNWIDASISKTINIPEDMPYEEFVSVYDLAFEAGLKGCTTYRPSDVRGSILSAGTGNATAANPARNVSTLPKLRERPAFLEALTAKIRWPGLNSAAYVHLGYEEDQPFEIFLSSKDQRNNEWMTTATLFMSWLLRMGVPLKQITDEMKKVTSVEGYIVEGRYKPSLISFIGHKLEEMADHWLAKRQPVNDGSLPPPQSATSIEAPLKTARCPKCLSPRMKVAQGCEECIDCGHSKCS